MKICEHRSWIPEYYPNSIWAVHLLIQVPPTPSLAMGEIEPLEPPHRDHDRFLGSQLLLQFRPPLLLYQLHTPPQSPPFSSLHPTITHATQRNLWISLLSTNLPVHGTLLNILVEFDLTVRCELSDLFVYLLYLCMLFVDLSVVRALGKGRRIWGRKCRPWLRLSRPRRRVRTARNGIRFLWGNGWALSQRRRRRRRPRLLAERWVSSAVDLFLWACVFGVPGVKSIIENGRDCFGDSSGLYYVLIVWHHDLNE